MSDTAVSFDILARDQLNTVLQQLTRTTKALSGDIKTLSTTAKTMGQEMHAGEQGSRMLSEDLRRAGESAQHAAGQLGTTGRAGKEAGEDLRTAGRRAETTGSQLRAVAERAQEAGDRVKHTGMAVASFVGNIAANAVSTLVNTVAQAAKSLFDLSIGTAASNQTAAVSFDLLLGSGQKAKKFLDDLQKFAAATPFDLPTLKDAASRLLAVGVNSKDVIPIMTRLGDATAGMGTGAEGISRAVNALQQMKQAGKASLDDINQLTDAGIPALDALAAHFHTTVANIRDMISKGKIKASDVFAAIEAGEGPAFRRLHGMMDKQSATLAGVWSTFKDNISQSLGKAFEPLIPAMTQAVNFAAVKVPAAIDTIKAKSRELADWWRQSQLAKLIGELAEKFNFGGDIQAIKNDFQDFAKTVKAHQKEIEEALYAVAFVIGLIVKGFLGLIQLVLKIDTIMVAVWSGVVRVIGNALNAILSYVETVAGAAAKIPGPWQSTFQRIHDGAVRAKDGINDAMDRIKKDYTINVTPQLTKQTLSVRVIETFGAAPQRRARGGPTSPGPVLVGEEGPELLYLSQPGSVVPARQTAAMMSGAGGGVIEVRPVFDQSSSNSALGALLEKLAREGHFRLASRYVVSG